MKSTSASVSRLAVILVILAMSLTSTVLMNGQEAEVKQAKGVPSDWTHQHVVFSNPGSADEAIRNGTYERWLKISTDPRYIMQQQKRSANASGAALQQGSSQDASAAKPVALEPRAEQADARVQAREEDAGAIEMSLEEREAAQVGNRRLPSGLVRAIIPPPIKQADSPQATKKKKRNRIKKDWSETLGSNGTTGLGEFPAIYTSGGTDCNDFAVFNTSLLGTSGQANIIAYNNLYTSKCGVPTVYWAYNTGGTVFNSVVLSYDSTQVAFVQSSGGVASLVLLKWEASNGTLTTPAVPPSKAAAAYNGCTAPCMTTFTFSGSPSPNDSYSAPFINYGTTSTAYVGDDAGYLHKFTNIFASGANTPAEATSPWPVKVNANASLASPVYDTGSTNVFVGDYLLSSSSACEPSATNLNSPCGYLYSVNSSGTVTKSAQLDRNFGIMDGPIVDPSAKMVYAFAGDDGSTSCTASTPCAAVYQFPVSFSAGASGTEATVGAGYEFMMSGTFDNLYFNSSSSTPTGNLYVVGNTGSANNTLYQVSINAGVMSTSTTAGPEVSNSYSNGYYAAGLQVAEFDNGTKDYIFLSVLAYGFPSLCGTGSLGNGCVIGYDVTNGTISGSTTPTGAAPAAGGTSGIVVDNGAAGASNIYFSTLLNQGCTTSGGNGGCAIQLSQSKLQ